MIGCKQIFISVLTCEEYLVYPYRKQMHEKINAFYDFASDCGISFLPINMDIAQKAAHIRADFPAFKPMDALQLASAVVSGCDTFLTDDSQLLQFKEIQCILLENRP